ncbi:MAG: hypothetical protein KC656_17545, partial [Myxococcales bacterium]|nr:hypothetical protein [Myxococcales bacterium]
YAADDGHAWLLLRRGFDLEVLAVDASTGVTESIPLIGEPRNVPDEMVADGRGGVWVSGLRRRQGTLTWMDPTGGSHIVEVERRHVVTDLSTGRDGEVQAALRTWRASPHSPLVLLELEAGEVRRRVEVLPDVPATLLSGRVASVPDGEIAFGTWEPVGLGSGAAGFWVARIQDGVQTSFTSLPFAELDHALAFLGERREARVDERLERKRQRGRDPRLRWNVLLHDPVPTPSGWVLVGEAYYPVTRTEQRVVTVPDGRGGVMTRVTTVQVFVGWAVSHAVVVGFDTEGRRIWDHSVRLGGIGPTLEEHVRVLESNGAVTLLYPNPQRVLQRAVLSGGELVVDEEDLRPDTTAAVRRNRAADAVWWHDDVFLLYGVDRLERDEGNGRTVFFLTTLE